MLTIGSRYRMADLIFDSDTNVQSLGPRALVEYYDDQDTIPHTVTAGDTLQNLAAKYFSGVDNPATLWWVIADFQPEPILDPTVRLTPGQVLLIPGPAIAQDAILGHLENDEVSV